MNGSTLPQGWQEAGYQGVVIRLQPHAHGANIISAHRDADEFGLTEKLFFGDFHIIDVRRGGSHAPTEVTVKQTALIPSTATGPTLSIPEPAPDPDSGLRTPVDFPASTQTLVPSGAKARVRANIAALRLLRTLQQANRPATPDEQRVLAAWSGWGAVPQVFDTRNQDLAAERDTLAELLDRNQYRQAEASILNAHYTDPAIAAVIRTPDTATEWLQGHRWDLML